MGEFCNIVQKDGRASLEEHTAQPTTRNASDAEKAMELSLQKMLESRCDNVLQEILKKLTMKLQGFSAGRDSTPHRRSGAAVQDDWRHSEWPRREAESH